MNVEGARDGFRHLVRCRCVLSTFRAMKDPPNYEFVVFSELENDRVIPKIVQCDNCGVLHNVDEAGKSSILNAEDQKTSVTIDDLKMSLSPEIVGILERHAPSISTWERAAWLCQNGSWGEFVVLDEERVPGGRSVKIMTILGKSLVRLETKFVTNEVTPNG